MGCLCKTKEKIIIIIMWVLHGITLSVLKYDSFLESLKGKTTHMCTCVIFLSYMYRRKIKPLQVGIFFFFKKILLINFLLSFEVNSSTPTNVGILF